MSHDSEIIIAIVYFLFLLFKNSLTGIYLSPLTSRSGTYESLLLC